MFARTRAFKEAAGKCLQSSCLCRVPLRTNGLAPRTLSVGVHSGTGLNLPRLQRIQIRIGLRGWEGGREEDFLSAPQADLEAKKLRSDGASGPSDLARYKWLTLRAFSG